jgi:ABC-2 type transport system ATP-binding protein
MLCHRVTIIDKGRIVAIDSPQQLRQRLHGTRVIRIQLRGEPATIEPALKQLPGVVRVSLQGHTDGFACFDVETQPGADVREVLFHLAVERRWALRELSQGEASLEEVFIHLTTKEQEP